MSPSPEVLQNTPPVVEIPQQVEQSVVEPVGGTVVPQAPSVPVTPPQAIPMATPIPAPVVPSGPSITIPQEQAVLLEEAKGSAEESKTGWAKWWLRKISMAVQKHIMIVVGKNQTNA